MPQTKRHWLDRATDPSTPATEDNETVRTETYEVEGKYYLVPTIRLDENGKLYKPKDPLREAMDNQDALIFSSQEEADSTSKEISELIGRKRQKQYAKGGMTMNGQMNLFAEGGMMDDSGDVVNGVEVPPGSLKEEVADDVPAKLSEGEFVIPADVVRYIGLEKLMAMRDKAKMGLERMQEMGQMGNAQEVENPDQTFSDEEDTSGFESEIDNIMSEIDQPAQLATGGFISGQDFSKVPKNPVIDVGYYKHSDGRMMWITKINGKPMSPPPDGFTEVDAEEAKKGGLQQEEKEEEAAKEAAQTSGGSTGEGGGGGDQPAGKTGPVAKNITIDPKTGKATVKTPPEWLAFIPGGGLIAAGMKFVSAQQRDQWNEALAKGNIVNAVPDAKNPDGRNWVDITNVENTGYGINVDGKSFSSNVTIAAQDDAIFGGSFDKDGNFVETDSGRASASETTNVSTSTGANTADPGVPTTTTTTTSSPDYGSINDFGGSGDSYSSSSSSGDSGGSSNNSTADSSGGFGNTSGWDGGGYWNKGGLVKRKYPEKKKSKKTGLASK